MTKREQQELLLRETKKTLQRELAHFKGRKILTSEELIKIKEASQMWNERIHMKKKWTPLEELQFEFYRDKKWLVRPIIEHMIFHVKRGPYDQSLKELEHFDIDVRDLLLRILRLKEERDSFHNQAHELEDRLISSLEDRIRINEDRIRMNEDNIKMKELEIFKKNPLKVV